MLAPLLGHPTSRRWVHAVLLSASIVSLAGCSRGIQLGQFETLPVGRSVAVVGEPLRLEVLSISESHVSNASGAGNEYNAELNVTREGGAPEHFALSRLVLPDRTSSPQVWNDYCLTLESVDAYQKPSTATLKVERLPGGCATK